MTRKSRRVSHGDFCLCGSTDCTNWPPERVAAFWTIVTAAVGAIFLALSYAQARIDHMNLDAEDLLLAQKWEALGPAVLYRYFKFRVVRGP